MAQIVTPGTATAADVIAGKKFNAGVIWDGVGTVPVRNVDTAGLAVNGTLTAGRLYICPPAGAWDGSHYTYFDDPDWIAANIPSTVNMFGLQGTLAVGKKMATGVTGNVTGTFDITGLSFSPSKVMYYPTTSWCTCIGIASSAQDIVGESGGTFKNVFMAIDSPYAYQKKSSTTVFTADGVSGLLIYDLSKPWRWIAYE